MAIYAIHRQEPEFIFIINYKVMFSSLKKILSEYFPEIKFYYKNQVNEFKFSDYPKFSIVRNPYSRTVSTYYDKCQKAPEVSISETKTQLQFCQYQLLQSLKILRNKTYEIVEPAIFCEQLGKELILIKKNRTDNIRPDIDSFYNKQTRKLVNHLYKIDFKKYNYPFQ